MKNTISPRTFALTLFLTTFCLSCASLAIPLVPALEQRTLRISPDSASLEYQYEVCIKHKVICWKKGMKKDVYNLADPVVRKQLIDMGFVARVREKI